MINTTVVQKFQDGTEVPQAGFAPFTGGGSFVPITGVDMTAPTAASAVVTGFLNNAVQCDPLIIGNGNLQLGFVASNGGFYLSVGAPEDGTDVISTSDGLCFNATGTPGTALAPGTLIYQTSDAGATWTAIL